MRQKCEFSIRHDSSNITEDRLVNLSQPKFSHPKKIGEQLAGDVISEKSVSVCEERFGFDPDEAEGLERKLAVERGITRRASRGSSLGFPRPPEVVRRPWTRVKPRTERSTVFNY